MHKSVVMRGRDDGQSVNRLLRTRTAAENLLPDDFGTCGGGGEYLRIRIPSVHAETAIKLSLNTPEASVKNRFKTTRSPVR